VGGLALFHWELPSIGAGLAVLNLAAKLKKEIKKNVYSKG